MRGKRCVGPLRVWNPITVSTSRFAKSANTNSSNSSRSHLPVTLTMASSSSSPSNALSHLQRLESGRCRFPPGLGSGPVSIAGFARSHCKGPHWEACSPCGAETGGGSGSRRKGSVLTTVRNLQAASLRRRDLTCAWRGPPLLEASWMASSGELTLWALSGLAAPIRAMATQAAGRRKTGEASTATISAATGRASGSLTEADERNIERYEAMLDRCEKPTVRELRKKLNFRNNVLGLDEKLKNGRIADTSMAALAVEYKRKFPNEVIVIQVGDFYEAWGYDALLLVEYGNLNPMGGLSPDRVPRAGFPLNNLRGMLSLLLEHDIAVAVLREVPGGPGERRTRFLSGHSLPGSPYVYGMVKDDGELDYFPLEEVAVLGLARSARGFTLTSVFPVARSYRIEELLTEEGALAKIRCTKHSHGFLHSSIKEDSTGMTKWSQHGLGGRLFTECLTRKYQFYEGDQWLQLLDKVTDLYPTVEDMPGALTEASHSKGWRKMEAAEGQRPRPLYTSAASQIGILYTAGVPSLLNFLLPQERSDGATSLCRTYLRGVLLNPPPLHVALATQAACEGLSRATCTLPDFPVESASKLVQLLRSREASPVILRKLQHMAEHCAGMLGGGGIQGGGRLVEGLWDDQGDAAKLQAIAKQILVPTELAAGIQMEANLLVRQCITVAARVDGILAPAETVDGSASAEEALQKMFKAVEAGWRGRVQTRHVAEAYARVKAAAKALDSAVSENFLPVISWCRQVGGKKVPELVYGQNDEVICIKGKNVKPQPSEAPLWADDPGAMAANRLELVMNGRGKAAARDRWTCKAVEEAREEYLEACDMADKAVSKVLRDLAAALEDHLDAIIISATFSMVAKALALHVRHTWSLGWAHARLQVDNNSAATEPTCVAGHDADLHRTWDAAAAPADNANSPGSQPVHRHIAAPHPLTPQTFWVEELLPYWLNRNGDDCADAVLNSVALSSMCLLTGPNGGGKSSMLRALYAVALLANCGLMVPAREASVPHYDALYLRMMAQDSPADGKSSFQVEMAELGTLLHESSFRSLVLVDELCKGTEVLKGTGIVGAVLETLTARGCTGMVSTHLHGVLDLPLRAPALVKMCMKARRDPARGGRMTVTWRIKLGECRESLAVEVARGEGVPLSVLERAEELFNEIRGDVSPVRLRQLKDAEVARAWVGGGAESPGNQREQVKGHMGIVVKAEGGGESEQDILSEAEPRGAGKAGEKKRRQSSSPGKEQDTASSDLMIALGTAALAEAEEEQRNGRPTQETKSEAEGEMDKEKSVSQEEVFTGGEGSEASSTSSLGLTNEVEAAALEAIFLASSSQPSESSTASEGEASQSDDEGGSQEGPSRHGPQAEEVEWTFEGVQQEAEKKSVRRRGRPSKARSARPDDEKNHNFSATAPPLTSPKIPLSPVDPQAAISAPSAAEGGHPCAASGGAWNIIEGATFWLLRKMEGAPKSDESSALSTSFSSAPSASSSLPVTPDPFISKSASAASSSLPSSPEPFVDNAASNEASPSPASSPSSPMPTDSETAERDAPHSDPPALVPPFQEADFTQVAPIFEDVLRTVHASRKMDAAGGGLPRSAPQQRRPRSGPVEMGNRRGDEPVLHMIGPGEVPPTTTARIYCTYVLGLPTGRFYVDKTDDLSRRLYTHRLEPESRNGLFLLYAHVHDISAAGKVETMLIRRLQEAGLPLNNKGD
eukprot:TRINITY_DN733_c0_g3_i5.p1 TRINITY_DN733_c0_g3~~TRINITY_DN733_c0_g3_i5.p1  ORF type:complete len:1701 (+),score=354.83 TRINITY_DN733_c0_g3_i5:2039-7141(+)